MYSPHFTLINLNSLYSTAMELIFFRDYITCRSDAVGCSGKPQSIYFKYVHDQENSDIPMAYLLFRLSRGANRIQCIP